MDERTVEMQNRFAALFTGTFLIVELAFVALLIIGWWKIYEKAGQPGWAAIIPIYHWIIMLRTAGKPTWWVILFFIPFVNLVFFIWTLNMISKSFGKDEGFTVGLVLLRFIFVPILGFGSAKYIGPYGDPVQFQAAQQPHFDFEQPKQS